MKVILHYNIHIIVHRYAYNTIIKKIKDDCKKICIKKKYNNYPSNENNIKNLKKHCPHLQ